VGLIRLLDDGRRQIVDLQVAGELTAFDPRPGARTRGAYVCLTPVRYADLSELGERVLAQPDLFPGIVSGLRRADHEAHARLHDQIVRLGRMLAHERLAHFALDLYRRHERAGLIVSQTFPMPLTQEMLGDVLGLSTVHVNRTLQQMRRDGLLKTTNGRWQIPDMDRLRDVASGTRSREN
jgi:CRP-like cAMP-binding protein